MTADGTPRTPQVGDTITVRRPHVEHGPVGVPADQADASYLRSAARNIEHRADAVRRLWGSGVTAMVVRLLTDAAEALEHPNTPKPATGHHHCANCEGIDPASCINAEPSTGDAVERAARAAFWNAVTELGWDLTSWERSATTQALNRALAAARDGEAEPSPLCDCGEPKDGHSRLRDGEAVDREAIADACDHCTDTECTHDCEPGAGPTPRTAAVVFREHRWFVKPDGELRCRGCDDRPAEHPTACIYEVLTDAAERIAAGEKS